MYLGRGQQKIFYTIRPARKKTLQPRLFVLLHGLSTDHNNSLIAYLSDKLRFEGDVLLFDFSGFGKSSGGVAARRYTKFVKDLKVIIDWVGHQPRFKAHQIFLVGHSAGAIVGLIQTARKNPGVHGLVVIAGNAESERIFRYYKKKELLHIYRYYSTLFGRHRLARDFWNDRSCFKPLELVTQMKVPVLYIYGSQDQINPVADGKRLYKRTKSRARLAIIKGASHSFKSATQRSAMIKVIKTWLSQTI